MPNLKTFPGRDDTIASTSVYWSAGILPAQTSAVFWSAGILPAQTSAVYWSAGILPAQTSAVFWSAGILPAMEKFRIRDLASAEARKMPALQ
jgi:hypothetical protein